MTTLKDKLAFDVKKLEKQIEKNEQTKNFKNNDKLISDYKKKSELLKRLK